MQRLLLLTLLGLMLTSVQVSAKDVVARSFCPMTGVIGIGRGQTFEIAKDAAIKACISKGGQSTCCFKFVRQIQG